MNDNIIKFKDGSESTEVDFSAIGDVRYDDKTAIVISPPEELEQCESCYMTDEYILITKSTNGSFVFNYSCENEKEFIKEALEAFNE